MREWSREGMLPRAWCHGRGWQAQLRVASRPGMDSPGHAPTRQCHHSKQSGRSTVPDPQHATAPRCCPRIASRPASSLRAVFRFRVGLTPPGLRREPDHVSYRPLFIAHLPTYLPLLVPISRTHRTTTIPATLQQWPLLSPCPCPPSMASLAECFPRVLSRSTRPATGAAGP